MRIYISLPISGHDYQEQKNKAWKMAKAIIGLGHQPVNPFETTAAPSLLSEQEEYAWYMGQDIEDLLKCDAAYFAKGWENSRGCRLEHAAAEIYGLAIYNRLDQIDAVASDQNKSTMTEEIPEE